MAGINPESIISNVGSSGMWGCCRVDVFSGTLLCQIKCVLAPTLKWLSMSVAG
jgi:hypothetical protein